MHRLGRPRTVRIALLVAAVTQLALAAWLTLPAVLGAAFVLGAAGQVVKLCADAAVQGEVGDEARGRVFALYDAVFNVCYVLAVAVAALLAPPTGVAPGWWRRRRGCTCSACWPTTACCAAPPGVANAALGSRRTERRFRCMPAAQRSGYPTPFSAAHRRSSASASSAPSGPRSIRSASRCR